MKPTDYPNLYSFMKEAYPKETRWLEDRYPNMMDTAKETSIWQWQEEWAVADRNPEVIEYIQVLQMALNSGLIMQEQYDAEIRKLPSSSKTLATAFIDDKAVAFREFPSVRTCVHELGHVHFKTSDLEWNSSYGGGENLIYLTYSGKGNFTEENIQDYLQLYRTLYFLPDEKVEQAAWIIGETVHEELPHLPVHPVSQLLFAGIIPIGMEKHMEDLYHNEPSQLDKLLENGKLQILPPDLKSALLSYVSHYVQDGFLYNDPLLKNIGVAFFKNLDIINTAIQSLNRTISP